MATPKPTSDFLLRDGDGEALTPEVLLARVDGALGRRLRVVERDREPVRRRYLDTFDGRLFRAGLGLSAGEAARGTQLVLQDLRSGAVNGRLFLAAGEALPTFEWDLPDGPLRARLAPILEMRALLPRVEVTGTARTFAFLNEDAKTVARLVVRDEDARCDDRAAALGARCRLVTLKGYDRPAEKLRDILAEGLKLEPMETHPLEGAMAAVGVDPAGYSNKLSIDLSPGMPSVNAMRVVLLDLLSAIETNFDGTVADLDSEFLHDLRVGVRRTRSALGQVKGVLPPAMLDRFVPGFRWLGQITGPTRDLDVYLLDFESLRAMVPEAHHGELDPLRAHLIRRQRSEQRALARGLRSKRCARFLADWRAALEGAIRDGAPNAQRPIDDVARERTWKTYRRVLREGRAIDDSSPDEALHDLRKTCKKLRYLMEFFRKLYPKGDIAARICTLKQLQTLLGDFNDCSVQIETLRDFGEQMLEAGTAGAGTLMAMGSLSEAIARKSDNLRSHFAERFADFDSAAHRAEFEALFKPTGAGLEPTAAGAGGAA